MQQRKIIEDYLDSVIPQKISESTKKRLRAEIECHIYDRADFYMEIGYDEDAAFEKAIEQMGEGEEVKTEFESLYNDSTSKAVLLFVSSLFIDLTAVLLGFGGAIAWIYFQRNIMWFSYESLMVSACFVCFTFFTIHYAYMHNQPKKLIATGFANIIMSLLTAFANSAYYPFALLLTEAFNDLLFGDEYHYFIESYLSLIISVPVCILSFLLYFKLKKAKVEGRCRKITFRRLLGIYVVAFAVICTVGWYICNTPVSEYFNYSGVADLVDEQLLEPLKSNQTHRLFDSITGDTDFSKAQELLEKEGFIPHTVIEDYMEDKDSLAVQLNCLKELLKFDDEIVYAKPYAEGYMSFFGEYIAISPSENGKVKYKKLGIEADAGEKEKTVEAKEAFENFRFGDDKQTVLKTMKKNAVISSYSVDYDGYIITEFYEFNAFKNLSFLSLIDNTYFSAVVVFENDFLKGGEYTYTTESKFETDYVVCDKTEYVISE